MVYADRFSTELPGSEFHFTPEDQILSYRAFRNVAPLNPWLDEAFELVQDSDSDDGSMRMHDVQNPLGRLIILLPA
jgi:hypothetical protein